MNIQGLKRKWIRNQWILMYLKYFMTQSDNLSCIRGVRFIVQSIRVICQRVTCTLMLWLIVMHYKRRTESWGEMYIGADAICVYKSCKSSIHHRRHLQIQCTGKFPNLKIVYRFVCKSLENHQIWWKMSKMVFVVREISLGNVSWRAFCSNINNVLNY